MGNIFADLKYPEFPDFDKQAREQEALQHARLARQLQAQQALMQQAEFTHKQGEWDRTKRWESALGSNPLVDPETGQMHPVTMKTLMGISPAPTLKLAESIADQAKARREDEIKKQEWLEKQQQLALHDIDSGMQIADPQERLTYVMQNWERYKKLKVLTDDEHEELARTGLTVPLHDRMATRLLGQEKFNEYQKKALELAELQKKAKSEDITRPAEETTKLLTADKARSQAAAVHLAAAARSKSQDQWTAARNEVPEQDRMRVPEKLDPNYDPLELGMSPTEIATRRDRQKVAQPYDVIAAINNPRTPITDLPQLHKQFADIKAYQASIHPSATPIDIPGIIAAAQKDPSYLQGLPGDVYARALPELSRLGIARPAKNPITPAIKGKVAGIRTLEAALKAYEDELKKVGPTFQAEKGAALNTAYINLMSLMKGEEMYQLGVLQGGDRALIDQALTDPSSMRANFRLGTSGMLDQMGAVRNMLAARKGILNETYDIPEEVWSGTKKPPVGAGTQLAPASTQPTANAQPSPKLAPSPILKPGSVFVRTPDGVFTFSTQAEADAYKKKAGL